MANGVYGTRKPAHITSNDVDIFYYYRPTRSSESPNFSAFKRINSNLLTTMDVEADAELGGDVTMLPGVYNLNLSAQEFNRTGIYTVYIRPKEIVTTIVDRSSLATDATVSGIVLRSDGSEIYNNGNLTGYRIEYLNDNLERTGEFRIITSNNRCEPVSQNVSDSMQKGIRYRFNDSSNLIFCTVTPSTAMSFKTSDVPYIGENGDRIILANTKFNPVMIEVEITDHDIESISTMLEGKQIRNLDYGLITTFDKDGGIYHQAVYGNIVNPEEGINHDFKFPKTSNVVASEIRNLEKIEDNI